MAKPRSAPALVNNPVGEVAAGDSNAGSPPRPHGLGLGWWLLLSAALLAALAQAAGLHGAPHARQLAARGALTEALAQARASRRLAPWHPHALYTEMNSLKRMDRWQELAAVSQTAQAWTPEASNACWLGGEASIRRGATAAGLRQLWSAFWLDPTPSPRPVMLWRLALAAARSLAPGGAPTAQARACAAAMLTLLPLDPALTPAERSSILGEAAAARR